METMGLFQRIFGQTPLASPWTDRSHLETITLADLTGLTADQVPITRALAMSVPAMARARNVLCSTGGRLPLYAYTAAGPAAEQPYATRQPDPGNPLSSTITWSIDQLLFYGRAWWHIIERSPDNRARRFRLVAETDLKFNTAGTIPTHIGERPVPAADWVRIDGPHEGVLNYGARALRDAIAIEISAGKASRNPVPAIELHQTTPTPSMTDQAIKTLIRNWVDSRNDRNGQVAYTPHSIEARVHGAPVEQLLIAGRKAAALDIARLAGVPAWAVDAEVTGSSLTYNNVESRNRELIDYSLAPYLAAIEARISMDDVLPRGTWAHFDTDPLTRGDLQARATAYLTAQQAGILTPEQCRDLENGKPKE